MLSFPFGTTGAPMGAVVSRVPVAHARRAACGGVRQTDALLARLDQRAFEIAGYFAEKGGV